MLQHNPPSKIRTLLILGRVSNLPTIWSNCLAGWWLGGGGRWLNFLWLCFGATFLYLGGMFLNDACDTDFDFLRRSTRPIPSGRIAEKEVWRWGLAWMILGCVSLGWISRTTAILTLLLSLAIVIYNLAHKLTALAPVMMASCRFLLYLVAASAAASGVTGLAIWSALALGCYIFAVSALASKETIPSHARLWPMLLLAAPVALAFLVDTAEYSFASKILPAILSLWVLWALYHTFWSSHPNIGFTVSRLLAGIVLVDLLAVPDVPQPAIWLFPLGFLLCLFLQRFIPAT